MKTAKVIENQEFFVTDIFIPYKQLEMWP